MKNRYTVIDNKTGYAGEYSAFIWRLAWFIAWLLGVIVGAIIF